MRAICVILDLRWWSYVTSDMEMIDIVVEKSYPTWICVQVSNITNLWENSICSVLKCPKVLPLSECRGSTDNYCFIFIIMISRFAKTMKTLVVYWRPFIIDLEICDLLHVREDRFRYRQLMCRWPWTILGWTLSLIPLCLPPLACEMHDVLVSSFYELRFDKQMHHHFLINLLHVNAGA